MAIFINHSEANVQFLLQILASLTRPYYFFLKFPSLYQSVWNTGRSGDIHPEIWDGGLFKAASERRLPTIYNFKKESVILTCISQYLSVHVSLLIRGPATTVPGLHLETRVY